jgi:hypothetical protein
VEMHGGRTHYMGEVGLAAYMVDIHVQVERYGGRGIHYMGRVGLGTFMVDTHVQVEM